MKLFKAFFSISVVMANLWLLSACGYTQYISGNGNIKSETRQVSNFTSLDCSGTFYIFLRQGNNTRLKIEADENLIPYIISDIHKDKLVLKTKDDITLSPTQLITVYLTMKNIEAISVSHFCKLQSQNTLKVNDPVLSVSGVAYMNLQLKAKSIKTRVSGRGTMNIKGRVISAKYHISGTAGVMADSLITDSTEAHVSGNGELHVNTQKEINAFLSGNGKILYKGNPQIKKSISGMGKIIKE